MTKDKGSRWFVL